MHIFLVCARKSQDIAQSQKIFARSHDRMTARFRNSAINVILNLVIYFKRFLAKAHIGLCTESSKSVHEGMFM